MKITQSITLDFARSTMPVTVFAKQYDADTREIVITPLNNGAPYTIESGITARLQMTKNDGTTVINNATISSNTITVTLTAQALAAAGTAVAEIGLYKNSTLLSSQIFYIDVQKGAYDENAVKSSNEYRAFMEGIPTKTSDLINDSGYVNDVSNKMDLAPQANTDAQATALSKGQLYTVSNGTVFLKRTDAGTSGSTRLALYSDVSDLAAVVGDANDLLEVALNYQ